VASLAALGAVAGFVGRAAGASLGRYWQFAAGLLMVAFGLAALRLVPFSLPSLAPRGNALGSGAGGALLYGLGLGGATTACSFGCNPLLPVAIGAAAVQGAPAMGAAMTAAFALGYALPLAAFLVGIGMGLRRLAVVAQGAARGVRVAGGALLVVLGFFLLATV
jgi:cytochrome c biogenesis protein CcdA